MAASSAIAVCGVALPARRPKTMISGPFRRSYRAGSAAERNPEPVIDRKRETHGHHADDRVRRRTRVGGAVQSPVGRSQSACSRRHAQSPPRVQHRLARLRRAGSGRQVARRVPHGMRTRVISATRTTSGCLPATIKLRPTSRNAPTSSTDDSSARQRREVVKDAALGRVLAATSQLLYGDDAVAFMQRQRGVEQAV